MIKSIIPFLLLFALLVIVVDVTNAQKACTTNAQCRRNSCIIGFCRSPSQMGGPCDAANGGDNGDCWGGNVCINAQCSSISAVGQGCDNGDDCDDGLICAGQVCDLSSCNSNDQCATGNTCLNEVCAPLSGFSDPCDLSDVDEDCIEGLSCESSKCSAEWIPQTNMPQARSGAVAETIGNSIFIVNGFNPSTTARFQPDATPSQWPTSPSYDNVPDGGHSVSCSAVVDGKIFVMGGQNGGPLTTEVWSFDPSQPSGSTPSDQWKSHAPMPGTRTLACATSYRHWIYLFGGRSFPLTDTVFVFDTSANDGMGSWTILEATLPQALAYCAAAQAGEYIYVTGGSVDNTTPLNTIYRFKPDGNGGGAFDPFPNPVPTLLTSRMSHTATAVNGKIFLAGGTGFGFAILKSVEMFDPSTNTLSYIPDMSVSRYYHQAAALDSTLFVMGGLGSGSISTLSVESIFLPA